MRILAVHRRVGAAVLTMAFVVPFFWRHARAEHNPYTSKLLNRLGASSSPSNDWLWKSACDLRRPADPNQLPALPAPGKTSSAREELGSGGSSPSSSHSVEPESSESADGSRESSDRPVSSRPRPIQGSPSTRTPRPGPTLPHNLEEAKREGLLDPNLTPEADTKNFYDPARLAKAIREKEKDPFKTVPKILYVGPDRDYMPGAIRIGELYTHADERNEKAFERLRDFEEKNPNAKNEEIVIYCGCCPLESCPVIKVFWELKNRGYTNVKILNLPNRFAPDWREAGYPVDRLRDLDSSDPNYQSPGM